MNERDPAERIRSYRDLIAWQKAMDLCERVYRATDAFPKAEVYGLTSQMRRAAVSIPSNIAEGQARNTRGELLQFLGHASGSLAELDTQSLLASRIGLLADQDATQLHYMTAEVGRLIGGLKRSLSTNH